MRNDETCPGACGSIGLGAIVAAKARGAQIVIASEPSPKRRELAKKMGADIVVDPFTQDPIELWNQMVAEGNPLVGQAANGILIDRWRVTIIRVAAGS